MGRYVRGLRSDLNPTYPSIIAKSHRRLTTSNFHPPYGSYNRKAYFLFLVLCFVLGYLCAAYKPYTRISPLHDRGDYWYFGGVDTVTN